MWGFAGLALGVLATLAGRRAASGRRRRPAPGPDQVGTDGDHDLESEPVLDAEAAPDLDAIRDRASGPDREELSLGLER
jgi:hypothetical protein